jgi:hypothetical protein
VSRGSRLGRYLIERLRTRLVDVQAQNQLEEGSIALAKSSDSHFMEDSPTPFLNAKKDLHVS